MRITLWLLASLLVCPVTAAFAAEADFLQSISGNFSGGGTVRLRTNSAPITVKCSFQSNGAATALTLEGTCRGLLIVSRAVSANIAVSGSRYSGTYIGAGSGTARLTGGRSGNRINFAIRWAKNVNGDRDAVLTVEKVGGSVTTDRDPTTGASVNTSDLNLSRR